MAFSRSGISDGSTALSSQLLQVIRALEGDSGQGQAIALTALSSASAYALDVRNLGAGGALRVKSTAGTTLLNVTDAGVAITTLLATTLAVSNAGNTATFTNTDPGASSQVAIFEGDSASPANNDAAYVSFKLSDIGGNQDEIARLTWKNPDVSITSSGVVTLMTMSSDDSSYGVTFDGYNRAMYPAVGSVYDLGRSAVPWQDLYVGGIAASGVITAGTLTSTGALNVSGAASINGVATVASATATPAGGSTAARVLLGTTAGLGIYYGSGAPTVSAAKGSLYIRSDGSGTGDRMYVNTNGTTTWTAVTTAA